MVDLHCHLLPGIDDGAGCWEESIALAKEAASLGISTVVVTPHAAYAGRRNHPQSVMDLTAQLRQRLQQENIPLQVREGMEIPSHEWSPGCANQRHLCLAGSQYVCLEPPPGHQPLFLRGIIFESAVLGYRPLLVHPERCEWVQRRPEILGELVASGAQLMVNAGSLVGLFGEKVRHAALELVRRGLCFAVCSDAHSRTRSFAPFKQAYCLVERQFGPAVATRLFRDNPGLVTGAGT